VARPLALGIALLGSSLDRKERLAAAWFGPKGFASVVYALLILEAGLTSSDELFHLAALVIVASILAHSSTDVLVARWFEPDAGDQPPGAPSIGPSTT
jgi:sodium/hydrogen antiporter